MSCLLEVLCILVDIADVAVGEESVGLHDGVVEMQDGLVELGLLPVSLRRQTTGGGGDDGEGDCEGFYELVEDLHSFELVGGVEFGGVISGKGRRREERVGMGRVGVEWEREEGRNEWV